MVKARVPRLASQRALLNSGMQCVLVLKGPPVELWDASEVKRQLTSNNRVVALEQSF